MPKTFAVMTDEHVSNAVTVVRLIDVIPVGTPDPNVLDYCHQHGYALITLDTRIISHIRRRMADGQSHAGVFIGTDLQGEQGVGAIVTFITFYNQAIQSGAATVEDDVYNQIICIK